MAYNASLASGDTTNFQQQNRLLSCLYRENNIRSEPNPNRQFILDLQSWVEHLQSLNHEKKLALDANTTYDPDVSGYQCRLNYHAGKPTINKQHDGKLGTLVATCGLQDPLALQHPDRLFPASHICGTNYIIVSPNLMPALCQSGSLAFHYLMLSDHRAHYVDFDALHLFFDPAYPIAPPSHR
jgi:hypothetical protein